MRVPRPGGQGGAAHPNPGSRCAPTHAPAWSGPCRPRVAAAGHARARRGRGAALPTWTSSSGGSRGPAAGGGAGCGGCWGAGCACGWWCWCFSSSPKSAASRAGFAAPSTGLSCANTGSSCGAGGWGTGPRRALMVSTRVAMGTRGAAPGAGRGSSAFPPRPRWLGPASCARGGGRRRGGSGRTPQPTVGAVFEGAHEKQNSSAPPRVSANVLRAATFSRPAPLRSLTRRSPLPSPLVSANELQTRVPAPRLLTLDARVSFTQL